jgi:hypothetical protein
MKHIDVIKEEYLYFPLRENVVSGMMELKWQ